MAGFWKHGNNKFTIMKLNAKNIMPAFLIVLSAFFISGCVEHRYYREHHDHSPEWHHHHDHVDVNIHN
jgi:hypothetical protein